MQDPTTDVLWTEAAKYGAVGLLVFVFILALARRKLSWGFETQELKAELQKKQARIDALEGEIKIMMANMMANSQTTGAAVEGFNRALDEQKEHRRLTEETVETLQRSLDALTNWDGRNRRRAPS